MSPVRTKHVSVDVIERVKGVTKALKFSLSNNVICSVSVFGILSITHRHVFHPYRTHQCGSKKLSCCTRVFILLN